jgi:plasmid stabilization system protein ParE
VLSEVKRLAALIAEFPEMGRSINGTNLRYHVTARYRYRLIYRVRGERVEIVEVLHPRRGK